MKKLTPVGNIQFNVQKNSCRLFATDGFDTYELELSREQVLFLAGKVEDLALRPPLFPQTVEVATIFTLFPKGIAIICDREASSEIAIGLDKRKARALGEALCSRADELN